MTNNANVRPSELLDAQFAALNSRAATDAARALVDAVYKLATEDEMRGKRTRKRRKTSASFRRAVEAFVGDLLRARSHSKARGLVYRALRAEYFTGEEVSWRNFRSAKDALIRLGFIEIVAPGYQLPTDFGSGMLIARTRATRFRGTQRLLDLAEKHGVRASAANDHFISDLPAHPLQLRAASKRRQRQKMRGDRMKFVPTEHTEQLEAQVRAINEFLANFDIRGGAHRGFIRVFNNGDQDDFKWNKGGRLYSQGEDSYQQSSQEDRLRMTIDGEIVSEIDIRASYLTVLHAIRRVPLDLHKDPYDIPGVPRDVVKRWLVATLGNNKHITRWPGEAIREYEEETKENLSKLYPVRVVRERVTAALPVLAKWGEPVGGRTLSWADLMFYESEAIIKAMDDLMAQDSVPSLPVHDSLIVPDSKVEIAERRIKDAYFQVIGATPMLVVRSGVATQTEMRA